jgi:hypothetical protein
MRNQYQTNLNLTTDLLQNFNQEGFDALPMDMNFLDDMNITKGLGEDQQPAFFFADDALAEDA